MVHGSTLIFLDPYAETEVGMNPGMPALNPRSDLKKLIDIWNIEFDNKRSVADPKFALRTVRNIKVEKLAKQSSMDTTTKEGINQNEGVLAQLSSIILTNSGSFKVKNDKTTFTPLLTASEFSGLVDADKAGNQEETQEN